MTTLPWRGSLVTHAIVFGVEAERLPQEAIVPLGRLEYLQHAVTCAVDHGKVTRNIVVAAARAVDLVDDRVVKQGNRALTDRYHSGNRVRLVVEDRDNVGGRVSTVDLVCGRVQAERRWLRPVPTVAISVSLSQSSTPTMPIASAVLNARLPESAMQMACA